jgi:lantibiotic modifying enzyme
MTVDYLELALGAERWIGTLQRATDHGMAWSHSTERPQVVSHTLYNGSAGVALFYLELHQATAEPRFFDVAVAAADDLAGYCAATQWQSCAMYTGWPGLAFALGEAARHTGRQQYATAAAQCLDRLRASAHALGAGIGWIEPMPFSDIHGFKGDREIYDASVGAAGAGFVLLYAAHTGLHPNALQWATQVGDRLLEVAQPTDAGLNWALMSDMPFPWNPANFAHGGAGVGAFMAMLYEATRHQRFLDAAKGAAAHLMHIAHDVGDGHLVHHHDGDGANLYYLSACHGPPGTTRLFHLLHRITGDATYSKWSDGALRGLLSTGAPETRSDGFWNNVSQCCGDAGVGDYAVNYYRATRDARYLDLAQREAAVLATRAVPRDGGLCWPQAEHRERPKFIQTQTGYMQGAAGIGSFFIHLHTTLAGAPVKIAFPDTPF